MCGRFTLRLSPAELQAMFDLFREPNWVPRYNIAPTQSVLAVIQSENGREPHLFRWGLIPSWAKDPGIGARMINARSETVADKPSFRAAFKRRRCLILADGFYEWEKLSGRSKQPYYITRDDERPFAFAGLWEHWTSPDNHEIQSSTIITGEPNELCAQIHDRMPIILDESEYDRWLSPDNENRAQLEKLLDPYPAEFMRMFPVSTLVNNPRNESPNCLEPLVDKQLDDPT